MRWIYSFFTTLISVISFANYKVNSSFVINQEVFYTHQLIRESNFILSSLISTKTNVLFSFGYEDQSIKFNFGDNYIFFGNGLVLGNPKYKYFLNYLFSQKFISNGIYNFDFYQNDRNFDGIPDIPRGIYASKNFGTILVLTFLFPKDIQKLPNLEYGTIVNYHPISILLFVNDNLYLSGAVKEINFLNLGIVFSSELATSVSLSTNYQIGLGASGTIEWYISRFELSLTFNLTTKEFNSYYSSSLYSISNRNGLIFSVIYSDDSISKFYGVNKLLIYDGGTENEFLLSFIRKLVKNVFLNVRFSREQEHIFLSAYPYFDNDTVELYIKPQVAFNDYFYSQIDPSYTLESGIELNFLDLEIGAKVFTPLSTNIDYPSFFSTKSKDNFGENQDIKIPLNDTNFLIFARLMKGKRLGLPIIASSEIVYLISLNTHPSYRIILNLEF